MNVKLQLRSLPKVQKKLLLLMSTFYQRLISLSKRHETEDCRFLKSLIYRVVPEGKLKFLSSDNMQKNIPSVDNEVFHRVSRQSLFPASRNFVNVILGGPHVAGMSKNC